MNHIYFVFATPPLKVYLHRYCIDYFKEQGWGTHILDVSPIMNPVAFKSVRSGLAEEREREIFFTKKEYCSYVNGVEKDAVFILTMDFYLDSYFIHRAIKKEQSYGYLSRIDTNVEVQPDKPSNRLFDIMNHFSFHRILNSIFIRVPRRYLKIKPASFIILGGLANREEYMNLCFRDETTIIKHIHSLDYEKYLEIREDKDRIVKESYCVFLDQFIPYHPDNIEKGYEVDGEQYYSELTKLFLRIQEELEIKVVVAAHPRSDYSEHKDIFQEFDVMRYKTAELIKDAEFVIAHFSTSISYAVVFHKPLVFISTNSMQNIAFFAKLQKKEANLLGKRIINISEAYSWNMFMSQLSLKPDEYSRYIEQYLTPDRADKEPFCSQLYNLVLRIQQKN